ncbi:MAG TPA: hypothetical protein VHW01_00770 [Polyangiaceae bacterium]|nr:hypothetical protein [Polyangiaceae bacterium]
MPLLLLSRVAAAQDAPPTPTSPPTAPTAPTAPTGPPPDAPPPFAEPSPAPAQPGPPETSQPVEPPAPAPTPPQSSDSAVPKTGSASFEPLPAPAREEPKRALKPTPAAPSASAPAAQTPPAESSAPRRSAANAESANATGSAPADSEHDSDDANGIFGPFRLGFLLGGGLPDLVSLGGILKLTRYFGAGINVGLIPTVHLSLYGDATLSFQEYDAYARIFPFGGSLFLGAGVGYATVRGTLATNFNLKPFQQMLPPGSNVPPSLDVSSQASVRTLVLTPQLGLLHTFGSGFSLGADIGAQLPIAPSQVDFTTQIPSSIPPAYRSQIQKTYIDPNDAKVRSSLDKIGRTPIPTFNIKIGFLL